MGTRRNSGRTLLLNHGTDNFLDGGVIGWGRVLGVVVSAPGEDGGFDGMVRDDGGKIGGGAIGKNRVEGEITANLDGDSIERLTRWNNNRVEH